MLVRADFFERLQRGVPGGPVVFGGSLPLRCARKTLCQSHGWLQRFVEGFGARRESCGRSGMRYAAGPSYTPSCGFKVQATALIETDLT